MTAPVRLSDEAVEMIAVRDANAGGSAEPSHPVADRRLLLAHVAWQDAEIARLVAAVSPPCDDDATGTASSPVSGGEGCSLAERIEAIASLTTYGVAEYERVGGPLLSIALEIRELTGPAESALRPSPVSGEGDERERAITDAIVEAQAELQSPLGWYRLKHGEGNPTEERLTKTLARLHALLAALGCEMAFGARTEGVPYPTPLPASPVSISTGGEGPGPIGCARPVGHDEGADAALNHAVEEDKGSPCCSFRIDATLAALTAAGWALVRVAGSDSKEQG